MYQKIATFLVLTLSLAAFAGCSDGSSQSQSSAPETSASESNVIGNSTPEDTATNASDVDAVTGSVSEPLADLSNTAEETAESANSETGSLPVLEVRFGREGTPFQMQMEDNDTAREIARLVGQADWNLPIYNYDDFEGWEYMQYYDIPSRYDIPSGGETVTSASAGEVYYSDPNRIILFYHDAEINMELTRIGTIEGTEDFTAAVENNPVQEGWGNKIVSISSAA